MLPNSTNLVSISVSISVSIFSFLRMLINSIEIFVLFPIFKSFSFAWDCFLSIRSSY